MQAIDTLARVQDKVMLVFKSHGVRNMLSLHAGNQPLGILQSADLVKWLMPLHERPHLLVISACYSGSFIPSLRNPKASCTPLMKAIAYPSVATAKATVPFSSKSCLASPTLTTLNLREAMKRAIACVAKREAEMKLSPPSSSQCNFGSEALVWARQPTGDWLKPLQSGRVGQADIKPTL